MPKHKARSGLDDIDPWSDYIPQLFEAPDRISVIVGAEMLSLALERLLQNAVVQSSKLRRRLFESPNAPAATFSSRIDLCYAMGLLQEYEYKNFHEIRALRNMAAHDPGRCDLNEEPTASVVRGLSSPYEEVPTMDARDHLRNLLLRHFTDVHARASSVASFEVPETDHSLLKQLRRDRDDWVRRMVEEEGFTVQDGVLVAPPGYKRKGQSISGGSSNGVHFSEVHRDGELVFRAESTEPGAPQKEVRAWLATNRMTTDGTPQETE